MSVIGGSISACHGSGDDPTSPMCYPSNFSSGGTLSSPTLRRSSLTALYVALSATTLVSALCTISRMSQTLIIVEMDTHDIPGSDSTNNFHSVALSPPFQPCTQFYNVPPQNLYFSTNPSKIPILSRNTTSTPSWPRQEGHELLKNVLVSYVESKICKAWSVWTGTSYDSVPGRSNPNAAAAAAGVAPGAGGGGGLFGGMGQRKGVVPEEGEAGDMKDIDAEGNRIKVELPENSKAQIPQHHVPPARMNTKVSQLADRPYEEIAPFCVSANDLINPLPPSLFYGSGWNAYHPKAAGGGSVGGGRVGDTKAHYWYSTLPTSKLHILITVGAGDIGIYYLVEPRSEIGEGSSISCWVDDNYDGRHMLHNVGDVREAEPMLAVIDHWVSRGSHFVECQLNGEEGSGVPVFKIIGIFST
ncbi:hypothetical protein VKT23_016361 [Stygiomarasmius scandens]|uniref:Uncharacterized protein n=1 Tax=Marasmiellus scandens TaxID=2682957 RepID=A0ABR1IYF9_9AGAR